jgi:hypothetical protein
MTKRASPNLQWKNSPLICSTTWTKNRGGQDTIHTQQLDQKLVHNRSRVHNRTEPCLLSSRIFPRLLTVAGKRSQVTWVIERKAKQRTMAEDERRADSYKASKVIVVALALIVLVSILAFAVVTSRGVQHGTGTASQAPFRRSRQSRAPDQGEHKPQIAILQPHRPLSSPAQVDHIIVSNWYGRLGNNLIQMWNSLAIAEALGAFRVSWPSKHELLGPIVDARKEYQVGPSRQVLEELRVKRGEFFFNEDLPELELSDDSKRHWARQLNLAEYLTFVPLDQLDSAVSSGLVIHVRSGDFENGNWRNYIQPPLAYYMTVIRHFQQSTAASQQGTTRVLLVSESDRVNPVVNALIATFRETSSRIEIQAQASDDLKKDISTLVNARHLVIGAGTFAYALALCNVHLETLYCPSFHNVYDQSAPYRVHVMDCPDFVHTMRRLPTHQERHAAMTTWPADRVTLVDSTKLPKEGITGRFKWRSWDYPRPGSLSDVRLQYQVSL